MESKFIPTLQVGNGYTYLKLRGVLDEDNLLANLLSQIQGRLLLIDMAEMERINSCGVRDWVNWLNQIQALGLQVILLRCSPAVVAQANMVTNFAADAFIHSFYAPYVHPDTGEEQSVLLFTEDLRQGRPIRAPKIYNDSGEELEFDEFEESYFAFVSDPRMMNYQVPSDVQRVIQYFMPESATHQPVIQTKSAIANAVPMGSVPAVSTISAPPNAGPAAMGSMNPMSGAYGSAANVGYGAQRPTSSSAPYGGVTSPSGNGLYQNSAFGGNFGAGPSSAPPSSFSSGGVPSAGMGSPMMPSAMSAGQRLAPGTSLPTPSSPVRHEQPPLPTNQGYQHLQGKVPVQGGAQPSPSVSQSPSQLPEAGAAPQGMQPQVPGTPSMPASPSNEIVSRPGSSVGGMSSRNDMINGISKKTILIVGACFVAVVLILLIFIIVKLAS